MAEKIALRKAQAVDPRTPKIEAIYEGFQWLELGDSGVDSAASQQKAACNAVLDTAELLEEILRHVALRPLVRATRVSRTWHKLVLESPTLRKKLFLAPTHEPEQYCRAYKYEPQIGAELQFAFWPTGYVYMETATSADGKPEPTIPMTKEVARLSRFMVVSQGPMIEPCAKAESQPLWERKVRDLVQASEFVGYASASFRKGAMTSGPWRVMYLTMPPCKTVDLECLWHGKNSQGQRVTLQGKRTIHRETSITCEFLFTADQDLLNTVEGRLELWRHDPEPRYENLNGTTVSSQLDALEATGFKMKRSWNIHGYDIHIPGVAVATPSEWEAMERSLEEIKAEAVKVYCDQMAMFEANRDDVIEDCTGVNPADSLEEEEFPEIDEAWKDRVEQATMWKERALRRKKK